MRIIITCLFIVVHTFSAYAQDYEASLIPKDLLEGADAVMRYSETTLSMNGPEDVTYKVKTAVTVLNEKGDRWGGFAAMYDKLQEITSVKITLYNGSGKKIKNVKKAEIVDMSSSSFGSLYDDNRMKVYGPVKMEHPYTIVTEVEKRLESSLQFPEWNVRYEEKIALERASLKVLVPSGYQLRYKMMDYEGTPVESKTKDEKDSYEWVITDLPAVRKEYRGPEINQVSPRVILAPSKFSMEGQIGSMSSWKEFGQWIGQLNDGRDQLSDELKSKIQKLTAEVSSEKDKIKVVYDYLQSTTRYVSIQLGIGGFQPFDALSVEENGYGDCKALSNFTYSLLKSIGIKSNYTLITAGESENDILVDFPSQQFNHVILAVPNEKDTVWLECTSQEAPFNFLGGFTSDRHALMITDDGGVVVKTPKYSENDNSRVRFAEISMDEEGNASAEVTTRYKSRQYDDKYSILKESKKDQKRYLLNSLRIPIFEIEDFSYQESRDEIPELTEKLTLKLKKYGSKSGKRIFFTPNLMNRGGVALSPKKSDRQFPILNRYAYTDLDSLKYTVPKGYIPELIPENVLEESAFGSFELSYSYLKDEIIVVRKIVISKGIYDPSKSKEYFEFNESIVEADKEKIVLIKNND